jgi:hypothetical protein
VRILEIENYFQAEETLGKVLEECKADFELVDYYANSVLKTKLANNPDEAKGALLVLAGVFSNLSTILSIAITEKNNRETREYDRLRIEAENADKKYTSAGLEKSASLTVGSYRRIRNIIEGYMNGCEKMIVSLQSTLKNEKKNYNNQE